MHEFLMFWLPWALSAATIMTMWLAGSRNQLGWWLGIASQVGWFWLSVQVETWGLLVLPVVLTFVYARNLYAWSRPAIVEPVVD